MTKDELCKAADVSPSTIDRDIRAGFPLTPTYPNAKGSVVGKVEYADAECQAYIKFRLDKISPVMAITAQKTQGVDRVTEMADSFLDKLGEKITCSMVAAHFETAKLALIGSELPVVELKDKGILSLTEAAKLSGIPRHALKAAYLAGKLKGFKNDPRIGRGYRFERMALQHYVFTLNGTEDHQK